MDRFVFESLERRTLLAFNPTPAEQELLDLVNRMRQDPADELNLLIHSSDADTNEAINYFKVNLDVLAQQWASLTPVQPLAWNASLRGAAIAHTQAMLDADEQTHQAPGEEDLSDRLPAAGYADFSSAAENVYAYATSMFQAHASFAIDWGDATNGIQDPPGHRDNIMDGDYREAGIGVLTAPTGKETGPILVTEDFGARSDMGNSYFLGTVYNDANHDGFYEAGEGISGATITLKGAAGTFSTTSMSAGGYQIQVPAGTYTVTAASDALGGTITLSSVKIGAENVQQDFRPDMVTFASNNNGIIQINGTDNADIISVIERSGNLIIRRNGNAETFAAGAAQALQIFAGAGNDVIDFSGVNINTYVDAGAGNDLVTGGGGNDTITGGAGKNTLYGGDGNDRLNGSGSPDHLYGQAGDDRLYGNDGNDYLDGGGGVDRLFGGNGNDTLLGGGSNDKLYGQAGDDQLYGQGQADLLDGGSGTDAAQSDDLDTLVSIEQAIT